MHNVHQSLMCTGYVLINLSSSGIQNHFQVLFPPVTTTATGITNPRRHQIHKPVILVFINSKILENNKKSVKICKTTRMDSEQTDEDIFQKQHHLVC
jgi:hypothetical protein